MNDPKPKRRRRWYQFSLRTLFFLVLVSAVLCALVKWFGVFFVLRLFDLVICRCPYGGAVVPAFFALLCGVIGWAIARRLDFSLRRSASSVVLIALLIFAAAAYAYVGWARYPVVHRRDVLTPAALPHPDAAVIKLYHWFITPHTPSFSYYQNHCVWPTVRFTLDILVFTLAGITGGCLGLVAPGSFPGDYLKQIIRRSGMEYRVTLGRRTRRMLLLALVAGAAWGLLEMEQTRSQWQDAAEWAEMGAGTSYRNGKLVGLQFNIITMSFQYFENKQLGDADLMRLTALIDLEYLNLNDTQVTDAGLTHLKELTNLERLDLEGTQVTDAGLVHLIELTNLDHLWLGNTHVTDEGVEKLQKVLPNCEINH